mgnify:CR=1 FL=1
MVSIRIEGLSRRFGAVDALRGVTLSIREGELFFLLGPSGCGKTTLLRCLAGFCRPDAGRVYFGDDDVTDRPAHRRNTGMVFQGYALWPHMTVEQNVAFGLEMRRIPRPERAHRVQEALRRVHMADLARRRPNELSGGQQQRVALARALVVEPQCLLLDEPLSNLDAGLRIEMRAEIRSLCKTAGLTAVYVTHDQKEALSVADRIAVLRDGRTEQIGTPDDLYRRPNSPFVAGFLGETNFVEATVTSVTDGWATLSSAIGTLRATARASVTAGTRVVCSIRPESIRLNESPDGGANTGRGVLESTVHCGELTERRVRVGSVVLRVYELGMRTSAPSAPVTFRIAEDDVALLCPSNA